jgi:hypothetical protein
LRPLDPPWTVFTNDLTLSHSTKTCRCWSYSARASPRQRARRGASGSRALERVAGSRGRPIRYAATISNFKMRELV